MQFLSSARVEIALSFLNEAEEFRLWTLDGTAIMMNAGTIIRESMPVATKDDEYHRVNLIRPLPFARDTVILRKSRWSKRNVKYTWDP